MSIEAVAYYQERAETIAAPALPWVLGGEPVDLMITTRMPVEAAARQFCDAVEPVGPFAVRGLLAVSQADGGTMNEAAWRRVASLPTQPRFIPTATYADRYITPFAAAAFAGDVDSITVEAITRAQMPQSAFRRLVGKRRYYLDSLYEPSQVFLLTRAVDLTGRCVARVTVVQGIHDSVTYNGRPEYCTPRISGTALLPEELYSLPKPTSPSTTHELAA
jgi:hypothetical protein